MSDAKGDSYLEIESNVRILSLSIETDRLTITPSGTLQCRHHSIRAFHVFAVEQASSYKKCDLSIPGFQKI